MKKLFAFLLIIAILISVTACGNKPEESTTSNNNPTHSPTTADNSSNEMKVDENLLSVDITLPALFFEDQSEEEIKETAMENGCKKCTINEDGSVIYTMTKKAHKDMLKEMSDEFKESTLGFLEGENKVESFISIDYDDDFSRFDVYVDPAKFTSMDAICALGFYLTGAYYQAFAGVDSDKIDVLVSFIDNETKQVLETGSYQEYLENINN